MRVSGNSETHRYTLVHASRNTIQIVLTNVFTGSPRRGVTSLAAIAKVMSAEAAAAAEAVAVERGGSQARVTHMT